MAKADEARSVPVAVSGTGADEPRTGRSRRPLAVEYRVAAGAPADELRRRELELERLIIKAACNRVTRLAAGGRTGDGLADAQFAVREAR